MFNKMKRKSLVKEVADKHTPKQRVSIYLSESIEETRGYVDSLIETRYRLLELEDPNFINANDDRRTYLIQLVVHQENEEKVRKEEKLMKIVQDVEEGKKAVQSFKTLFSREYANILEPLKNLTPYKLRKMLADNVKKLDGTEETKNQIEFEAFAILATLADDELQHIPNFLRNAEGRYPFDIQKEQRKINGSEILIDRKLKTTLHEMNRAFGEYKATMKGSEGENISYIEYFSEKILENSYNLQGEFDSKKGLGMIKEADTITKTATRTIVRQEILDYMEKNKLRGAQIIFGVEKTKNNRPLKRLEEFL